MNFNLGPKRLWTWLGKPTVNSSPFFPAWPAVGPMWPGGTSPGLWGRPSIWVEASQIASLLNLAGMQWLALLCDLRVPNGKALNQTADLLDRYMRSRPFLDTVRLALRLLSL